MRRLFVFLFTTLMTLAINLTAWASPSFYANPKYNLSSLETIKIVEIINDVNGNEYAKPIIMPEEKMLGALYKGGQKHKFNVIDARESDNPVNTKLTGAINEAYLQVIVNDMTTTSRLVPGYWREETYYRDYVWYDRDGYRHVDRIPESRPVWVPDSWHTDTHIDVLYKLYDAENNVIASASDKRDRTDEDNPKGMLGRSAENFFKCIKKAGKGK